MISPADIEKGSSAELDAAVGTAKEVVDIPLPASLSISTECKSETEVRDETQAEEVEALDSAREEVVEEESSPVEVPDAIKSVTDETVQPSMVSSSNASVSTNSVNSVSPEAAAAEDMAVPLARSGSSVKTNKSAKSSKSSKSAAEEDMAVPLARSGSSVKSNKSSKSSKSSVSEPEPAAVEELAEDEAMSAKSTQSSVSAQVSEAVVAAKEFWDNWTDAAGSCTSPVQVKSVEGPEEDEDKSVPSATSDSSVKANNSSAETEDSSTSPNKVSAVTIQDGAEDKSQGVATDEKSSNFDDSVTVVTQKRGNVSARPTSQAETTSAPTQKTQNPWSKVKEVTFFKSKQKKSNRSRKEKWLKKFAQLKKLKGTTKQEQPSPPKSTTKSTTKSAKISVPAKQQPNSALKQPQKPRVVVNFKPTPTEENGTAPVADHTSKEAVGVPEGIAEDQSAEKSIFDNHSIQVMEVTTDPSTSETEELEDKSAANSQQSSAVWKTLNGWFKNPAKAKEDVMEWLAPEKTIIEEGKAKDIIQAVELLNAQREIIKEAKKGIEKEDYAQVNAKDIEKFQESEEVKAHLEKDLADAKKMEEAAKELVHHLFNSLSARERLDAIRLSDAVAAVEQEVYEKDNVYDFGCMKFDPTTCGCQDEFGDIFETQSDSETFETDFVKTFETTFDSTVESSITKDQSIKTH